MTDPTRDEIRQLLERSMTDAPEPLPWTDVERRATRPQCPPAVRRRTGTLARRSSVHDRPRGRLRRTSSFRRRPQGAHQHPGRQPPLKPTCHPRRRPRYHRHRQPIRDRPLHPRPPPQQESRLVRWAARRHRHQSRCVRSIRIPTAMSSFRPHRPAGGWRTQRGPGRRTGHRP